MTQLSKKLERLIKSSPEILPVKTADGILVGSVLIRSNGASKNLYQKGELLYADIHLNAAAIKIANLLAKGRLVSKCDAIYRADQEYGKWFNDSQLLRNQYEKAKIAKNFDRADMLWARYIESRNRTIYSKAAVDALVNF
jgi:hypothetical protein